MFQSSENDKGWGLEDSDNDDIELHAFDGDSKADEKTDPLAAITSQEDDPSLPTLTVRVFVIGLLLCCVGSAVSQLFYFKSNAPTFSSFFVILVPSVFVSIFCSDLWYLDIFANGQPNGRAFLSAYRRTLSDEFDSAIHAGQANLAIQHGHTAQPWAIFSQRASLGHHTGHKRLGGCLRW